MKKIILTLVITLWVTDVLAMGDASAGKSKSTDCVACHGINGESPSPDWPNLAGQGERYLVKQITEIKDGLRSIPEMIPFVSSLSEQDIADLASYYASLPSPQGATNEKYRSLGESLYWGGNIKKGIPACASCHSPTGSGNSLAGFPSLTGQKPDYTAKQLREYREGDRITDGDTKIMRTIAEKMSNKEIEAVAHYISGLR